LLHRSSTGSVHLSSLDLQPPSSVRNALIDRRGAGGEILRCYRISLRGSGDLSGTARLFFGRIPDSCRIVSSLDDKNGAHNTSYGDYCSEKDIHPFRFVEEVKESLKPR